MHIHSTPYCVRIAPEGGGGGLRNGWVGKPRGGCLLLLCDGSDGAVKKKNPTLTMERAVCPPWTTMYKE